MLKYNFYFATLTSDLVKQIGSKGGIKIGF